MSSYYLLPLRKSTDIPAFSENMFLYAYQSASSFRIFYSALFPRFRIFSIQKAKKYNNPHPKSCRLLYLLSVTLFIHKLLI